LINETKTIKAKDPNNLTLELFVWVTTCAG